VWPASRASLKKKARLKGEMAFDAIFEVFPEVKLGDLDGAEIERITAEVSDAAIDRTWKSCASSAALSPSARLTPLPRTATA
jgi:FKBP-type peptidyl-prolyl cis-trans isomerase (trigger factor)